MFKVFNFFLQKKKFIFLLLFLSIAAFFKQNFLKTNSTLNRVKYIIFYKYSMFLNNLCEYFNLSKKNKILLKNNKTLYEKNLNLTICSEFKEWENCKFLNLKKAKVLNSSIHQKHNFIIINKGSRHNIKNGMAVISENGIVGKVTSVFFDFSVISTVLNVDLFISAKIKTLNAFGSIKWFGLNSNRLNLLYIPKHLSPQIGQEVVTSEYSSYCNIPIGKIISIDIDEKTDGFYNIEVEPYVNMSTIFYVYILFDDFFDSKSELDLEIERFYSEKKLK